VAANAAELPRAYEQARTAVRIGRRLQGPGARATFNQLGAYRLLALVPDSTELRGYVTDVLGELAGDAGDAADLRHTLEVLIDAGGNVAEAARRLHFHYNTLRYRIEKLERMVGPFTANAALRLDLSRLGVVDHLVRFKLDAFLFDLHVSHGKVDVRGPVVIQLVRRHGNGDFLREDLRLGAPGQAGRKAGKKKSHGEYACSTARYGHRRKPFSFSFCIPHS
jgi:hypothetical protein